ncbi:uncharacterized protein AKAME5_002348400, partial [Lates japonicus]
MEQGSSSGCGREDLARLVSGWGNQEAQDPRDKTSGHSRKWIMEDSYRAPARADNTTRTACLRMIRPEIQYKDVLDAKQFPRALVVHNSLCNRTRDGQAAGSRDAVNVDIQSSCSEDSGKRELGRRLLTRRQLRKKTGQQPDIQIVRPASHSQQLGLMGDRCEENREAATANKAEEDSSEGLEVPLVAVLQWYTPAFPFTRCISSWYSLPSIRLDHPQLVMTASCPSAVRPLEHFWVKYTLLNNLQDFLAVRLIWNSE